MNAAEIDSVVGEARERSGHEPFLIEPEQTPIPHDGPYPFGEPAALPPICVVADFVSSGEDPLEYTELTVIWFQHDYAFPISPEAAAAVSDLDWERLARRQEW
jgi:hypothetical protein